METIKDVNPFVAVAAKKQRALKKKLEKIAKFEGQLAAGKVLDEEQLTLVHSKAQLERSLHDVQAMKEALEEVAKEVEKEQPVVTERHTHTHTVVTTEERTTEVEREEATQQPLLLEQGETETALTVQQEQQQEEELTVRVVNSFVSTTTETDVDEVVVTSPVRQVDVKAEQEKVVQKLLKALHVYYKYQDTTGRALPDDFDYFAKTLLGVTFLSSFGDALNNSRRAALNYVNDDLSEVCRGITYQQMSSFVDALAEEIDGSALLRAATAAVAVPAVTDEEVPLSFGTADLHAHSEEAEREALSFGLVESIASYSLPATGEEDEQVYTTHTTTTILASTGPEGEAEEEAYVVVSVTEAAAEEAPQTEAEQEKKKRVRKPRKDYETTEGEQKKREKKDFKKKKDDTEGAAAADEAPKKKSFLDSVKAGLPVQEEEKKEKAVEEKKEKKDFKKKEKKDFVKKEKQPKDVALVEGDAAAAAPVEGEKKEKKFRERKPREEKPEGEKKEGEGEKKERGEKREKREYKPKRETPAEAAPAAAPAEPAAPAVYLDDGFQQPRKHLEAAAKKAKKEAEQHQPKKFYPKKEGGKSPVPAAPAAAAVAK